MRLFGSGGKKKYWRKCWRKRVYSMLETIFGKNLFDLVRMPGRHLALADHPVFAELVTVNIRLFKRTDQMRAGRDMHLDLPLRH